MKKTTKGKVKEQVFFRRKDVEREVKPLWKKC